MTKEAWVTLVTNDTYGLGALVLGSSLRRVSTTRDTVVMVTPGVSDRMREELARTFTSVVPVDVMDSGDTANLALMARPELGVTFTKLHAWTLVQYSKCVFLDSDTLVVQNCDELFERDELSAAPDPGWPDCFNSGVFVFVPSMVTYQALLDFAVAHGSFDGGDQGLLNMFFREWATQDIKKHLPFIYNLVASTAYTYLPALKFFGSQVKIVHFLGANKPWTKQSEASSSPYQRAWWGVFREDVSSHLSQDMIVTSSLTGRDSLPSPPPRHRFHDPWLNYNPTRPNSNSRSHPKPSLSHHVQTIKSIPSPTDSALCKVIPKTTHCSHFNNIDHKRSLAYTDNKQKHSLPANRHILTSHLNKQISITNQRIKEDPQPNLTFQNDKVNERECLFDQYACQGQLDTNDEVHSTSVQAVCIQNNEFSFSHNFLSNPMNDSIHFPKQIMDEKSLENDTEVDQSHSNCVPPINTIPNLSKEYYITDISDKENKNCNAPVKQTYLILNNFKVPVIQTYSSLSNVNIPVKHTSVTTNNVSTPVKQAPTRKNSMHKKQVTQNTSYGQTSYNKLDNNETVRHKDKTKIVLEPTKPCFLQKETNSSLNKPYLTGVAGALARGDSDQWRKEAWEAGDVDYMGRDSFENIWKRICETVGISSQPAEKLSEPTAATDKKSEVEKPKPVTEAITKGTDAPVESVALTEPKTPVAEQLKQQDQPIAETKPEVCAKPPQTPPELPPKPSAKAEAPAKTEVPTPAKDLTPIIPAAPTDVQQPKEADKAPAEPVAPEKAPPAPETVPAQKDASVTPSEISALPAAPLELPVPPSSGAPSEPAVPTEAPYVPVVPSEAPATPAEPSKAPVAPVALSEVPAAPAETPSAPAVPLTAPAEAPATLTTPSEAPATPAATAEAPTIPAALSEAPAVPAAPSEAPAVPIVPSETPAVPIVPSEAPAVPIVPSEAPVALVAPSEAPAVPSDAAAQLPLSPEAPVDPAKSKEVLAQAPAAAQAPTLPASPSEMPAQASEPEKPCVPAEASAQAPIPAEKPAQAPTLEKTSPQPSTPEKTPAKPLTPEKPSEEPLKSGEMSVKTAELPPSEGLTKPVAPSETQSQLPPTTESPVTSTPVQPTPVLPGTPVEAAVKPLEGQAKSEVQVETPVKTEEPTAPKESVCVKPSKPEKKSKETPKLQPSSTEAPSKLEEESRTPAVGGSEPPSSCPREPGTPTVTPASVPGSPVAADPAPEVCKLQATPSQPATPPAATSQQTEPPVPPKRKQGKNGKPGKGGKK